jgi:hypothetical protein
MGIRFQKRLNLGKGFGFNFSKSGISPSIRTKGGSISSKGYSVRSGIPGLYYRSSFGKNGCLVTLLLLIIGSIIMSFIIF